MPSQILAPDDRRKLVGILSRLASDHDGERAAAGLLATRMLKARGLSWEQLVGGASSTGSWRDELRCRRRPESDPQPWRSDVQRCLQRSDLMSCREREFLQSLTRWTGALTEKQAGWLGRIVEKLDMMTGATP